MNVNGVVVRLHLKLVLSLALMVYPLALHSQITQQIVTGDRVRVSARSLGTDARIGIVTNVGGDKLSLVDPGVNGAAWNIPLNRLDGLEVRRVNEGNHKHKGALIGMITGFVAFGVIGYVATPWPTPGSMMIQTWPTIPLRRHTIDLPWRRSILEWEVPPGKTRHNYPAKYKKFAAYPHSMECYFLAAKPLIKTPMAGEIHCG